MAKFLHEFMSGQDNGYWEIRGNRLVNSKGGWHDYVPSPDDEIIEGTWDDVMKLRYKPDDSQITGWLAPDGTFYGCAPEDHYAIAKYHLGCTEQELEKKGFAKIFFNPRFMIDHGAPSYEAIRSDLHRMTDAQLQVLKDKGIDHEDFYM